VLTNALHLKARWAEPFLETRDAPFAAPSGAVTVDMMSGATGTGRTAEGWVSVELPYRDGTLSAVAVLPPEGADPCAVDTTTLAAVAAAEPSTVDVSLPRIKIEQTHRMLETLEGLGLPRDGSYPALGGDLSIYEVVQKTYLEVDEIGTEAAAATGVAVESSATIVDGSVVFDRPFLFLLTDTATGSPLFTTVVADPSS
jgi:serpin B